MLVHERVLFCFRLPTRRPFLPSRISSNFHGFTKLRVAPKFPANFPSEAHLSFFSSSSLIPLVIVVFSNLVSNFPHYSAYIFSPACLNVSRRRCRPRHTLNTVLCKTFWPMVKVNFLIFFHPRGGVQCPEPILIVYIIPGQAPLEELDSVQQDFAPPVSPYTPRAASRPSD